jgi:hypothetical protein
MRTARHTHTLYSPRNVSWPVEGFPPNLEKIRWEQWKRIAGQTHRHTDTQTHIHTHRNSPIYSNILLYYKSYWQNSRAKQFEKLWKCNTNQREEILTSYSRINHRRPDCNTFHDAPIAIPTIQFMVHRRHHTFYEQIVRVFSHYQLLTIATTHQTDYIWLRIVWVLRHLPQIGSARRNLRHWMIYNNKEIRVIRGMFYRPSGNAGRRLERVPLQIK